MSDFLFYTYFMKSFKSVDYGMVLIASLKPTYQSDYYCDIREIARQNKLPASFLEKLAQRFKKAGLLESRRGIGGGYRLIKNPSNISIKTIVSLIESPYQYCPITRSKNI